MPLIEANGLRHYCRVDGREEKPALIFAHSLGCDHTQWDAQAAAFETHFRVLRYDVRGHGATGVPAGDSTIEMLAQDAIAIADTLGIGTFAFCGLSLGGMIGQWIGARAGERLTHLVLANTSSHYADPSAIVARRKAVLESGMAPIEETVMGRFFMPETLAANPAAIARTRRVLVATDPAGYAGCCAAIRDMDHRAILRSIAAPTLIVIGERDVSTPWEGHGEILAREIPHTQVARLPTAHLSNLEKPRTFNAALARFLISKPEDMLAAGFKRRRGVLGEEYVDRARAATTSFTRDFQEFLTRCAWGEIWGRPGLDVRTRRLLVLATTAALGRWEEFRLHLRAGLEHDLEPCDVEEALLQIAIYAGVPAANTGFRIASEEIAKPAVTSAPE